jgi:hypothetical protein
VSAGAPDIATMLHAAASGVPHTIQVQPPGQPPQGGPQGPLAPSQPGGKDAFEAALTQLLDDLHAIVGLADDPVDRQELTKCLQVVTGIQATEQKEQDSALGGKVSPRQMRKAYGP